MDAIEHVESATSFEATRDHRRVVSDTYVRCAVAWAIVRLGMSVTEWGARRLSHAHPARMAYRTAVTTWRDRVRSVPWWGFVPTAGTISTTQSAWVLTTAVFVDVGLYFFGFPHVRMFGLLSHHVPQLDIDAHFS